MGFFGRLFRRNSSPSSAKPVYCGSAVDWKKYETIRALLAGGASDEDVLASVGELGTQEVLALLRADAELKELFYSGGQLTPEERQLMDQTEGFALRLAKKRGI